MNYRTMGFLGSMFMWSLALALVIGLLASCARTPLVGPLFTQQDRTVYGTLVKVERNEDYEARCGFLCRAFGGGDGPLAYDAQVLEANGTLIWFMFFAPKGNNIPHIGQRAFWRLRTTTVTNFARCSSYGCQQDNVLQLWSDEDVRSY
jgi:hypothetical protein